MSSNHFNSSCHIAKQDDLPLSGMEVLLCEDCIDQGRLILRYLTIAGAQVTLECNGLAAVETMAANQGKFQAVIMDFRMPKMDGVTATEKMREMGFSGGIIAVTSYDSESLKKEWIEAGCDVYMVKPLQRYEIIQMVSELTTSQAIAQ